MCGWEILFVANMLHVTSSTMLCLNCNELWVIKSVKTSEVCTPSLQKVNLRPFVQISPRTQSLQEWSRRDIWKQHLTSCFSCFMPQTHNTFAIPPSTVGKNAYHTYSLVYVLALQKETDMFIKTLFTICQE